MVDQDDSARAPSRRAQILEAALAVMAERGIGGASIKRISERAGLKSPALIYWYFKDKAALLRAVLEQIEPILSEVADPKSLLDRPPEEVLGRVARAFLHTAEQPTTGRLLRVLLSQAVSHPVIATHFATQGPLVMLSFLERYLAHQVELGRLHPHNPQSAARAFMGMLVVYPLGKFVFPPLGAGFPSIEEYGSDVVRLFLSGLADADQPGQPAGAP